MSNIETAAAALRAELAKAKEGAAFYASRVEALEDAIRQLGTLGGATGAGTPKKRGRKPGAVAASPVKPKHGRPAKPSGVISKGNSNTGKSKDLPSTKGTFWEDQITASEKSWADILEGAIVALGVSPTPSQREKLSQRMIFAVNALAKSGEIKDSGAGRDRRFFI